MQQMVFKKATEYDAMGNNFISKIDDGGDES